MHFLDKMLQDGISEAINGVSDKIGTFSGILAQSPDTYNPEIWGMMKEISMVAVMPFAYIFLSLFATLELYEIVTQYNNTNVIIPEQVFKLGLKVFLGIVLIENTFTILLAIFEIANVIILGITPQPKTPYNRSKKEANLV